MLIHWTGLDRKRYFRMPAKFEDYLNILVSVWGWVIFKDKPGILQTIKLISFQKTKILPSENNSNLKKRREIADKTMLKWLRRGNVKRESESPLVSEQKKCYKKHLYNDQKSLIQRITNANSADREQLLMKQHRHDQGHKNHLKTKIDKTEEYSKWWLSRYWDETR